LALGEDAETDRLVRGKTCFSGLLPPATVAVGTLQPRGSQERIEEVLAVELLVSLVTEESVHQEATGGV
jgi:hypothetical protein